MKPNYLAAVLGIAVAMANMPSYADGHGKEVRRNDQIASGMHAIPVAATVGQPGHGWRYFTDAREGRAVVISPSGDYFYSQGQGLTRVFKAGRAT